MKEVALEITSTCRFSCTSYDTMEPDVCLEYVERSTDHWHPDSITDIYLDKEQAIKIIAFLKESFGLEEV